MSKIKSNIFIPITLLIGLFLISMAYKDFQKIRGILNDGVKVIGKVSNIVEVKNEDSSFPHYKLTVEYHNTEGQRIIFKPSQRIHSKRRYKVGDSINVIYEENEPSNIMVDNNHDRLVFVDALLFGLMLLAISWAMYFFPKKIS